MTIHEAERSARETGRKLRHSSWPAFITAEELLARNVPVFEAISNTWETEPRTRKVNERHLRECLIPVLKKYLPHGEIDRALYDVTERLFKDEA